jgi:hypothetical protein
VSPRADSDHPTSAPTLQPCHQPRRSSSRDRTRKGPSERAPYPPCHNPLHSPARLETNSSPSHPGANPPSLGPPHRAVLHPDARQHVSHHPRRIPGRNVRPAVGPDGFARCRLQPRAARRRALRRRLP